MNKVLSVMENCASCPIRHRAVCARCDDDELEQLNQIKFYKTYSAGQTIAMRGDALDVVASVVAGTATLERAIEDGRNPVGGFVVTVGLHWSAWTRYVAI